jgi:patatin-like phospholipase/acyl hydrolase
MFWSPIRVMISATAVDGHNSFFVKNNPKNSQTTGGVQSIDAAVASASAPTYFDHWTIQGIQGQTISFFDGAAGYRKSRLPGPVWRRWERVTIRRGIG